MHYGANAIQKILLEELANYIQTQYFGKSPLLFDALSEKLRAENVLHKEPYIESSPLYKTAPDAFDKINPAWLRNFFLRLVAENLGVYPAPFVHQVKALENFSAGKDLLVATGTGSGKTECFMFPILFKLATEAHDSPETWQNRGVRVMIMYPMNALVSDQVSRLRKLLGDKFAQVFRETCGDTRRRPQFGMYTGRTPYAGEVNAAQDAKLKSNFAKITQPKTDADKNFLAALTANGKIPAKASMENFLAQLENHSHIPAADDAELVTRFEMQKVCPDILITNYSMLEYMLMRPREQKIWRDTKSWLAANPQNKLLFVIDEAHMYKGSAGGEVALLIRRLLYKLGIARDKVQFILTTASMPDNQTSIENFYRNLTAAPATENFLFITGEQETLPEISKFDISPEKILNFRATDFTALKNFLAQLDGSKDFSAPQEIYSWLYENLTHYKPFSELLKLCRGKAVSLSELAKNIFPTLEKNSALQAVKNLLEIVQLAKNDKGAILFPVRMHMLFRGIKGVYACANPHCEHSHSHENLTLGEIFLSDDKLNCECGGVIYELYNDRHCGALFFKGYVFEEDLQLREKAYLWRDSGQILDKGLREIHLYIPPENYEPHSDLKRGSTPIKPCWLDVKSGFLYFDERENCRPLYYSTYQVKARPDLLTFLKCPHCLHRFSHKQLTSFGTRGNQSFYNLIKAQFQNQPPVPEKIGKPEQLPNEGRKVLIFSDSRQRAATLARDMSNLSDYMAERQLFALAANRMAHDRAENLNNLYGYFCLAAGLKNIQLFSGSSRENFLKDCRDSVSRFRRGRKPNKSIADAPDEMKQILLRFFCAGQNTLYEHAISWLEPQDDELENALEILAESGVKVSRQEFLEFFNAWLTNIFDEYTALGNNFSQSVRESVRQPYGGFGLNYNWDFSATIHKICGWGKTQETKIKWRRVLENFLREANGKFYVDIGKLKLRFDLNHEWHLCETCKEISPYLFAGKCPNCGGTSTHILTAKDFQALEFWRKPIVDALNGAPIIVIDTEEHTAQLSHKDQRENFWAQTEMYELRFQDILFGNETPVDILSSTTTMEVGIDIGALVAVGLRNIPPMRENYQQRAGRAGRRGAVLSAIVTFCGDNPHDNLYFQNPAPMFNGELRRPYIDVASPKLIHRHLTIILFQKFLAAINESLDSISAVNFLDNQLANFQNFIAKFNFPKKSILLPENFTLNAESLREEITADLDLLKAKRDLHPELFGADNNSKSLLDALYEEGIIPTYSFPKNVVSVYISGNGGGYQPDRGLDVAISEYAPGRSIVVDKQTYQIGGIYIPSKRRDPARNFLEDKNYVKELLTCEKCGWFGLATENYKKCPFCGNENIKSEKPMLRAWGFAPKNATPIPQAQLEEEYSFAQPPEYSTLPKNEEMTPITAYPNIRMATRKNQRIIMLNKGVAEKGFVICQNCGATMPNTRGDNSLGANIGKPYRSNFKCRHNDTLTVNLGFDFVTDMLVLEFELDDAKIDTRNDSKNLWLNRAAQSLAEAFRLAASSELDVDFNELVTGYRIRRTDAGKTFADVYIYDNLSSGAGYSVKIEAELQNLLARTREILSGCNCESACRNCLKHYRNQFVHGRLDRHYGLELLNWGAGKLPAEIPYDTQKKYLASLESSYAVEEINRRFYLRGYEIIVYPAMLAEKSAEDKIYIRDSYFKYAKPYALNQIENFLDGK